MTRKNGLPRRVYLRHAAYYFVRPDGRWIRLSAEKAGLPAMYRALAALTDAEATSGTMPAVIARWGASKRPEWADKTAADLEHVCALMAESFRDFLPGQVTTPVCAQYLAHFAATPRTYNKHRTALRQVLAFAALDGLREGFNPIDNIAPKSLKPRKRYVPLVMVNRYGIGASTADGDGCLFTADQMRAYATAAVLAERERCACVADGIARQYAESAGGHSAERAASAIRSQR